MAVAHGHARDGVRRRVARNHLQLRQDARDVVGRVLAVDQQPVEACPGADLGAVGAGQAQPQADLRALVGQGLLERVDWGFA
jgi:hypothetical protein